jgi:hypothetical protein
MGNWQIGKMGNWRNGKWETGETGDGEMENGKTPSSYEGFFLLRSSFLMVQLIMGSIYLSEDYGYFAQYHTCRLEFSGNSLNSGISVKIF